MATINVLSLNVRGLRDTSKRRSIFEFYRKRCDILCLQETHSTPDDEQLWNNEWGSAGHYSHGTSAAQGVAIFIKKGSCIETEIVHSDKDGRILTIKVQKNEYCLCILNIYGPNHEAPIFFKQAIEATYQTCDKIIVIGDFNTVMDHALDRRTEAGNVINPTTTKALNDICDQLSLQDIWRVQNPESKRYSWYRTVQKGKGEKIISASRIDYALISSGLCSTVHDTFYLNGMHTDHSAFFYGSSGMPTRERQKLLEIKYILARQC